jgi:hypothetical protein
MLFFIEDSTVMTLSAENLGFVFCNLALSPTHSTPFYLLNSFFFILLSLFKILFILKRGCSLDKIHVESLEQIVCIQ